ncbi:MAG: RNA 2',3'-cyclic phosphodiesterase [Ignavibacteria bacterium]|nr:RNA 2',3'-cyclic phosphodiesterase [Ignavibacteria bacterium]
MMIRTFIALEIPRDPLSKILEIRDQNFDIKLGVKWETIEKLHITLKFLGDTNSDLINLINDELNNIILKQKKFELTFDRFGMFKKNNIPKILWVNFSKNQYLNAFAREIDQMCSKFGFESELIEFKPHLTLLRIKNEKLVPEVNKLCNVKIPNINFVSDKVIFFESKLLKTGSVYNSIKSFIIS